MSDSAVTKQVENLGMRWEDRYGCAQAVRVGDTMYIPDVLPARGTHHEKPRSSNVT